MFNSYAQDSLDNLIGQNVITWRVYLADGIDGTSFTGRRQNCGGINVRFLRSAVLLRPILSTLFNKMLAYRIVAEVLVILVGLLIKRTQE